MSACTSQVTKCQVSISLGFLLKKAYKNTDNNPQMQKESWDMHRGNILTPTWTNIMYKNFLTLCIHYKNDSSFIKFIEYMIRYKQKNMFLAGWKRTL